MPEQPSLWERFVETDSFCFERRLLASGCRLVAGLDEAGRGPLAGPVVAACVVLLPGCGHERFRDSKILTAAARDELYAELQTNGARIGVGVGSVAEIEKINILRASLLAMRRAVDALAEQPDFLLVDGKFPVPIAIPQQPLVKGESRSASIAAASIIAKVTRDRMMADYHERYPQYNFLSNKGYGTAEHRQALVEHGPCELHRRGFRGVGDEAA
ncbi:MAG: ribonuclease HII [Desulfobacteraceae bacterium]|nr:ribonuclease HII [Desulfobacteraceae bacterium]